MSELKELELQTVIGFSGDYSNGLIYTLDRKYIIYSLGLTVVIKNLRLNTQAFLHGHTDNVTCLAISHDGTKLASGQKSKSRGNKVPIILWDLQAAIDEMGEKCDQSNKYIHHLTLHMGKVQGIGFSSQDQFLYSIGGQDDNALVCWDVESGEPICGTPAGEDSTLTLKTFNLPEHEDLLVTGGNYAITIWRVDRKYRKFHSLRANLGNLRRIITCLAISPDDQIAYCGSKTGDILEIFLQCDLTKQNCIFPPVGTQKPRYSRSSKERFSQGICCLALEPSSDSDEDGPSKLHLLVGAGDGTLARLRAIQDVRPNARVNQNPIPTDQAEKLTGGVTSIAQSTSCKFYIGTTHSNVYSMSMDARSGEMTVNLRATCHYEPINDVIFPKSDAKDEETNSQIFLTCSKNDIRIWNAKQVQEILRIQVPNLICNCIDLTDGGDTIISGWDDGKIRAFYPESGKLKFVIQDAHNESVTAIAACHPDSYDNREWRMVSGGKDGRVRVWKVTPSRQTMEASMKEHRGAVNSIQILKDNSSCASASSDGSCIVWNLENYVRSQAMFASTVFRRILYHPDESQMLSCGSDRRITYFDSYDGEAIRILEEAADGELLTMHIEPTGTIFATGGRDTVLKLWHYDNGEPIAVGKGHSSDINGVKITPDARNVVTVGAEGAIMIWEMGNTMRKAQETPET